MNSWERFKRIVKHRRRYTFWTVNDDPLLSIAEFQPNEMLTSIGETVRTLPLATTLAPGMQFWRVRVHKGHEKFSRPSDFSSPPAHKAIYPNRMSPSGIPMFYGADDFDTAVLETLDPAKVKRTKVSGVAFQNIVPLSVLDLTAIPTKIGFFSDTTRDVREAVKFLSQFTKDISRPIKKDGTQHTEYVPTQVFTEFIRYELTDPIGKPFQGIKFPSSKNGKGCYVLFVEQDECLAARKARKRPQILSLLRGTKTTATFPTKHKPK